MEPPNESNPPPPRSPSFSSLPKDIVLIILARIPRSYYQTVSLVSKSFRSLILSEELDMVRSRLGTREDCIYVCLQSGTRLCDRRWFSLWIKPDDHQPLTQDWAGDDKYTENLLLPVPSSYSPRLPIFHETVGSETYEIGGQNSHSSSSTDVWVYDKLMIGKRRKAPSMTVARKNALTCSLDEKLYVIGGCEADESTYWAEVFDPKTQLWEPLPDPGADLRFSLVTKIEAAKRSKIYVRSNNKNFVYITKQSRWEVVDAYLGESTCEIEDVWYCYNGEECLWFDTYWGLWTPVKGLSGFFNSGFYGCDRHYRSSTEICNYGGKLAIVWVGPEAYPLIMGRLEIWCAVISLEKRSDGTIWGQLEWEDIVLLVPHTFTLLHCIHSLQ